MKFNFSKRGFHLELNWWPRRRFHNWQPIWCLVEASASGNGLAFRAPFSLFGIWVTWREVFEVWRDRIYLGKRIDNEDLQVGIHLLPRLNRLEGESVHRFSWIFRKRRLQT